MRSFLLILCLLTGTASAQQVCGPNGCQKPAAKVGFWERGPARRFTKNLLKLAAPQQGTANASR